MRRQIGSMFASCLLLSLTAVGQDQKDRFPDFVITPGQLEDVSPFPITSATLCLKDRTAVCYVPPEQNHSYFGRDPVAWRLDEVSEAKESWVIFSADSGGGSGWSSSVAILRFDDTCRCIQNLLGEIEVPNLGEWTTWFLPNISEEPLFISAEFIWEGMQAHYAPHRYTIKVFRYQPSLRRYGLLLRYATHKHYQSGDDDRVHLLEAEKPEVLRRLKHVRSQ